MDFPHLFAYLLSPTLRMPIGIVLAYLGALVGSAELLSRTTKMSPELTRKIVHIGSGNVILIAWFGDIPGEIGVAAAIVAGFIALISYFLPILPSVNSVGRQSLGTFFYALSMGILIWWFWSIQQPYFAVLGVLIMTWGDGLAAVIGSNFGKHPYKIFGNKKSYEGTATMFFVSLAIALMILSTLSLLVWQQLLIAVVIATVATFLESFAQFGIDNLAVPVGSAAIAFFMSQYFV
ncbi:MAG: phosphatidate cytidylyltransferase [Limnothrix sp. RL_2_0]|nr:phosphatidate cytidylyltransferase [Limnothrix sp. RL_2_0]